MPVGDFIILLAHHLKCCDREKVLFAKESQFFLIPTLLSSTLWMVWASSPNLRKQGTSLLLKYPAFWIFILVMLPYPVLLRSVFFKWLLIILNSITWKMFKKSRGEVSREEICRLFSLTSHSFANYLMHVQHTETLLSCALIRNKYFLEEIYNSYRRNTTFKQTWKTNDAAVKSN